MYLALLSSASGSIICMVSLGVSRSCSASYFVFIASFSFFRFFSYFFGGSEKIFCGLSKFLKNSVVVVVAFVYKQTVFVFPFCCPNQHLEYQLPSERDDCACAREMANPGSFGLHCVRFSDALALSKLIKV